MNNRSLRSVAGLTAALVLILGTLATTARSQDFDFNRLEPKARPYTVIVDMDIEISFGIHSNEQSDRYLGTIVSDDGLVIFDGSALTGDAGMSAFSGFSVKTVPTKIEVTTLDGKSYDAEYVGLDRFTGIGFLRIEANGDTFTPVRFKKQAKFTVGDWLGTYMLLPEFISPPLAGDIGMVSALVTTPQDFTLTVGFNGLEVTSVLYNTNLEPVGVLGSLQDPSSGGADAGSMMESFGQFGVPLLGVVTAEQLEKLIADPPVAGEVERGWLGITLQALTKDIAEFWGLDLSGGIIVNDIVKDSPASKAGLKVGDIIYTVNGQDVDVDKEEKIPVFQRTISEMGPGAEVELGVIRRTDEKTDTLNLLVTLGSAPINASDAPEYENKALEFKVRDLVFADYMITNQDPETFKGVVVSELKMGGLADVGGLQIGDIIQRIGSTDVSSIEEVRAAMEQIEQTKPNEVIFFVWRNNKTLFVNVKTDWQD